MHGRVEPVRALLEAECAEDACVELLLLLVRVVVTEERCVDPRRVLHELGQHRADGSEHLRDLGRQHVRLEVVEERRVGRVLPLEAFDVASLELEVPFERGQELPEVVRRARLDPDLVAERGRADHLRPQLGRNATLLLPVAPRDADEAGVVGVVLEGLLERPETFEQVADLGVREPLVRDPAEGRHRLGASRMPAGRHRHLLIPCQHADRTGEIRDLGEALPERAKLRVHLGGLYPRR